MTPAFTPASDQSLLVRFGDEIAIEANRHVVKLSGSLRDQPIEGVRNLHPGYCSLLVKFDALLLNHRDLESALKERLTGLEGLPYPETKQVEIPTCYGGAFGPDLAEVASLHGMTADQVVELHSSATYTVYFLGFVPGFAYLGGLPEQLATPRLSSPRRAVPAGSVGIAGNQTGVYPFSTPGGWRLIGRTPLEMFRNDRTTMSVLSLGDTVRFVPITPEQFTPELSR